jgi:hypothetical protein
LVEADLHKQAVECFKACILPGIPPDHFRESLAFSPPDLADSSNWNRSC